MNFATFVARHQRSILFATVLLVLAGGLSLLQLPVSLFPKANYPRIRVSLDAGIRPAPQMEIEVTRPVSLAIRAIPGVRQVRSTTSRGSADISVDFAWGTDMISALLQVEGKVSALVPSLPAGLGWSALRMDPEIDPVIAFSLTAPTLSPIRLRDIARYQLMPLLAQVPGVARVPVQGGAVEEYRVSVDPARLLAYGLTFADVTRALSASNVPTTVGRLQDYDKLFLVVSDTRIRTASDIRHTVLRSGSDGVVELEDVASIGRAQAPRWQRVTADGQTAVLVPVHQQPGANTVRIARAAERVVQHFVAKLGEPVTLHTWYDQGVLVSSAEGSVRDAIVIGVLLAALVLFAFLRSLKITLVAILVVPAVLATAGLLLRLEGLGLNVMSLGGAAAAVGLIIDDTIVMVEHVIRRLRAQGAADRPRRERILIAAREFTHPLAGSSASTVVIFAPLAFLSGLIGAFFRALAMTMASALLVSFLIAWIVVPLLAGGLLGKQDVDRKDVGPWMARVNRAYARILIAGLRRPWLALLPVVPLLVTGWFAFQSVGSGFLPPMDEGGFVLDYRTPAGTSLSETDRVLRQIGSILMHNSAVLTYSRRTGLQMGGGITEPNSGDFFIRLKPQPRPPIWTVMDQVRAQVDQKVPGIKVDTSQLMEDLIGDLTAVPEPIEVKLFGEQFDQLVKLAPKVAAAVAKVPGIIEVRDGVVPAGDAFKVHVDRTRAALEGLTPQVVSRQIADYVAGTVPTSVEQPIKMVNIRVWVPQDSRARLADVTSLLLRAPDGHVVPVGRIATARTVTGEPEVDRENLRPMIAVTARIQGRSLGKAASDVQRVLSRNGLLPHGVSYEMGGIYQQQQIAMHGLMMVFLAALLLVFLLLLVLYEQFLIAGVILGMPVLAVFAVMIGLWLTGTERDITAMMGLTMIVGIVTEIAIFYFSEFREARRDTRAARLVEAGVQRLRPIAMTTIAAILALAPLALGIGTGAALLKPLAIAIIAGLLVQMPLVLWVMPLAFHGLANIRSPRKQT